MSLRPNQRHLPQGPVPPAVKAELQAYLDRYGAFVPDDRNLVAAQDVAGLAQRALEARAGFSLIRLGDGEGGCLMGGNTDFPALGRFVAASCLSRHFGPRDWRAADLAWAHDDISNAVRSADVVTFARRSNLFRALLAGPVRDLRGVVGATWADIWLTAQRSTLAAAVYRDGYLHRDLLPAYPALIRGRNVVLVSSLGPGFAARFQAQTGAATVDDVPVTGQWSNGDDGPPLYPDGLPQVQQQLDVLSGPGRLVLVAAGLAAKGLCARAARNGAVAIDVGSVMDVWAGRAVRPYHADDFVDRYRL